MGVDLRTLIVIPVPADHMTEREVLRRAVRIARLLGPEHFIISPDGFHFVGNDIGAWQNDHPDDPLTAQEEALLRGRHAMAIVPPWSRRLSLIDYGQETEQEHYGRAVFHQDGEPKISKPDEQFIQLHWMGRYYGPNYERGHWPTIREAYAHILFTFPPGTEVWHGGDSSGVCVEKMTDEMMMTFEAHWQKNGNEPYAQGFGSYLQKPKTECPFCLEPMANYGFANRKGQDFDIMLCTACNRTGIRNSDTNEIVTGYVQGDDSVYALLDLYDRGIRGHAKEMIRMEEPLLPGTPVETLKGDGDLRKVIAEALAKASQEIASGAPVATATETLRGATVALANLGGQTDAPRPRED